MILLEDVYWNVPWSLVWSQFDLRWSISKNLIRRIQAAATTKWGLRLIIPIAYLDFDTFSEVDGIMNIFNWSVCKFSKSTRHNWILITYLKFNFYFWKYDLKCSHFQWSNFIGSYYWMNISGWLNSSNYNENLG